MAARGCAAKRRYATQQEAQRAAAALAARREKQGAPVVTHLQAYRCRCGAWHFGSTGRIDWARVR